MIRLRNGDTYIRPILACNLSYQIILSEGIPIDVATKDIYMVSRVLRWTFATGLTEKIISNTNGAQPITEISAGFFQVSVEDSDKGIFPS